MNRHLNLNRPAQLIFATLLFTALVFAGNLLSPLVKVDLSGSVQRNGRTLSLEEAGGVAPGEDITWKVTVSNRGDAAASKVQAVGQIPQGTVYVAGSASGDAVEIKYSLDGRAFSERPVIRVVEGGVVRERPAPPDSYIAVQFTFASVGTGEAKRAVYHTRVR